MTHLRQSHRYCKINQQKKFHLLNLIYNYKKTVREAAQIASINFLTAKTILFFHKNNYKTYQFNLQTISEAQTPSKTPRHATYTSIRKLTNLNEKLIKPKTRIEVICSIGNVLSPPSQYKSFPTRSEQPICKGQLIDIKQAASQFSTENHNKMMESSSPLISSDKNMMQNKRCYVGIVRIPEQTITMEEKNASF